MTIPFQPEGKVGVLTMARMDGPNVGQQQMRRPYFVYPNTLPSH